MLLNSIHTDLEVIVVNDGGEPFTYDDKRVKIIDLKENSGSVSIPRNIGLSWAQGEYICHTDDDVIHLPEKITLLSNALRDFDTLLAFGQRHECHVTEADESLIATWKKGTKLVPTPKDSWDPSVPGGWGVDNGQIMYKRCVYDFIDPVYARRGCDYALAKEIKSISINDFKSIPDVVCDYIWHNKNRSRDASNLEKEIHPSNFTSYFNPSNMPSNIPDTI
tara:strand:- start:147886 stop:148548 length:663 start_codon:yes stop_codon:yes gene_type:complete